MDKIYVYNLVTCSSSETGTHVWDVETFSSASQAAAALRRVVSDFTKEYKNSTSLEILETTDSYFSAQVSFDDGDNTILSFSAGIVMTMIQ